MNKAVVKGIKGFSLIFIVLAIIVMFIGTFYNVDTGQVGIVMRFGKVIAIKEEGGYIE